MADGLTPWDWRRTREGWQRAEWLMPSAAQRQPALHPSVVAMLELLLSIGALAAFPARGREPGEVVRSSGSGPPDGAELTDGLKPPLSTDPRPPADNSDNAPVEPLSEARYTPV
jgi:hypothetical protein